MLPAAYVPYVAVWGGVQAYVALSRGVSLDALRVLDYDVSRITTSHHLTTFSETIRRKSTTLPSKRGSGTGSAGHASGTTAHGPSRGSGTAVERVDNHALPSTAVSIAPSRVADSGTEGGPARNVDEQATFCTPAPSMRSPPPVPCAPLPVAARTTMLTPELQRRMEANKAKALSRRRARQFHAQ